MIATELSRQALVGVHLRRRNGLDVKFSVSPSAHKVVRVRQQVDQIEKHGLGSFHCGGLIVAPSVERRMGEAERPRCSPRNTKSASDAKRGSASRTCTELTAPAHKVGVSFLCRIINAFILIFVLLARTEKIEAPRTDKEVPP
jgi:hypothetical protein